MFQNFFSDYLSQIQQVNQQWWQDFDQNSSSMSTSFNKAMQDVTIEDTTELFNKASQQPGNLLKVQQQWWEQQLKIWQSILPGEQSSDVIEPEVGDRRFQDQSWQSDPYFKCIQQSYLLFSQSFLSTIEAVEGLDDKVKERLTFFSRQAINALSPSNFIATNPELLKITLDNQGENLVKGMEAFKQDVEQSADVLKIRMTNQQAFDIGTDVASTAGDVVYKNDLIELIQYKPKCEKTLSTPLLIVPPFINKYYILDLREKNSMVNWLLEQGHSVFMISWRNPGKAQANVNFEDYVLDGVVKAVSAIEEITGQEQINAAGYCIGGTVLAMTIAYYAAKRMKRRIKSATFFTTLLDYSQPGEVGAYINDPVINAIEQQNNALGYMDGRSLSVTFSLLRENSLYWNYYIDNYLKGQRPMDFDLLYWNSDSTNVSAATHNFLLRKLYLENALVQDKGVKIGGVWIDLNKIKVPSYFISTKDDHIALWQGTYRGALKTGGNKVFVLGQSGHIAGIVNHPDKNKYGYWVNDSLEENADEWLGQADYQSGSWWLHWHQWLLGFNQAEWVEHFPTGNENYPVLGPAPGDYVKQTLPIEE